MINADTAIYGVIGYPIRHSLSPKLHTAMFEIYSINAVYVAFETNNIKSAIEGIKALEIKGVNVTIPYKEDVIELIDEIDENANVLQAVNTIINSKGMLTGYNTDYLGFMYMFEKNIGGRDLTSKTITVLGAGGAAKSIIYALYKMGAKSLFLLNRSTQNALKTKEIFKDFLELNISDLEDRMILSASDVIINCTSVGLNSEKSPVNVNYIDKAVVMDIIYKDSQLIKKARSKNLKAINGIDMFVGQAFYSFELFSKIKFDMDAAYKLLRNDS